MSPVDLLTLVNGFAQAFVRFEEAAKETDPEDAFHALFEALEWAASIDERLGYPAQPELRGLRYVRNRVRHRWADALWLDPRGAAFPISLPPTYFEWRWRRAQDLPAGRSSRGEEDYEKHLAEYPARVVLGLVLGHLRSLPGASPA